MKEEFSASMMCANFDNLAEQVKSLDAAGIDSFHVDVMDGQFVDNFGLGFQDILTIRRNTQKPIAAHLMIMNPLKYLSILGEYNLFNTVYIHPEADPDPATVLEKIRKSGALCGIAINPGTSLSSVKELLYVTDRVLVLGVNPGHSGRAYQEHVTSKINRLLDFRKENRLQLKIELDGACTQDRIIYNAKLGVDAFVLGSSVLFNSTSGNFADKIERLRGKLRNS